MILLAALLPVLTKSSFQLSRDELVLTYMMVAIGLNFGFGYGGQLAIAQPVVMGVAAYTAGLLNVNRHWSSWAPWSLPWSPGRWSTCWSACPASDSAAGTWPSPRSLRWPSSPTCCRRLNI